MATVKQLCVFLLTVGLTPLTMAQGVATRNVEPAAKQAPSGRPFAASFEDIAAKAGLTLPVTVGNPVKKSYIIEANGTGLAAIDYDRDGWLDLFVVNSSKLEGFGTGKPPTSRLYRNTGKGTFTDVTESAGVGKSGWGNGVCTGDIDNDGDEDMFVTYWGPNLLYINNGKGRFDEAAERLGVAGPAKEWSSGCTFLDYDRDGRLDLFVTSYQQFDLAKTPPPGKASNCEWKGMPVFCGPRGLPFGTATLFHQKQDGTFENVTAWPSLPRDRGSIPPSTTRCMPPDAPMPRRSMPPPRPPGLIWRGQNATFLTRRSSAKSRVISNSPASSASMAPPAG